MKLSLSMNPESGFLCAEKDSIVYYLPNFFVNDQVAIENPDDRAAGVQAIIDRYAEKKIDYMIIAGDTQLENHMIVIPVPDDAVPVKHNGFFLDPETGGIVAEIIPGQKGLPTGFTHLSAGRILKIIPVQSKKTPILEPGTAYVSNATFDDTTQTHRPSIGVPDMTPGIYRTHAIRTALNTVWRRLRQKGIDIPFAELPGVRSANHERKNRPDKLPHNREPRLPHRVHSTSGNRTPPVLITRTESDTTPVRHVSNKKYS